MKGKRIITMLLLVVLVCTMFSACGQNGTNSAGNSAAVSKDTTVVTASTVTGQASGDMVIGIVGEPETLEPLVASGTTAANIRDECYSTLVQIDPTGEAVYAPMLAGSWDSTDTSVTFHLRKDVKFHDGAKMTADDVVYTLNWVINPDNGAAALTYFSDWVDRV